MTGKQPKSKSERLAEFYRRLQAAPPCDSLDEAFAMVCNVLNAVEDELADIPFDQSKSDTDGRLYPPVRESLHSVKDHPSVKRHRHRLHYTFFGENGSVEVQDVQTRSVIFTKPGRDGRGVWQQ
ncbi:MAG TPA: hypothetical protein VE988_14525 [Gemmataceae bacterium]|nr:hypothetical protein [Gemmataceae bacterium]